MSSILCQGLKISLEPCSLRHKNGEFGRWSFVEALTNISQNAKEVTEKEKVYVHPLSKHSSSPKLSNESLEMCTESLGSETGSDIRESSDEFSPISLKIDNSNPLAKRVTKSREFTKKLTPANSFPPPLSSISGSDGFRVRPHREDGRLVIKAVTVASSNGYFEAERVDGRLRLRLVRDSYVTSESVETEGKDEDDMVDDGGEGDEWVEDMGGNSGNVGGEIEIGEVARPRRCKEGDGRGNRRMANWGPFWVATS